MDFDIPVLFSDGDVLIVNKPAGILVHRSEDTSRHEPAILQIMRDRSGQHLYPAHRLDRPTSGVLVLARSRDMAAILNRQWAQTQKTYIAVVRGFTPEQLRIDHPLRDLDDPTAAAQEAVTDLRRLATVELDQAVDRYPRTRYSLCQLQLQTGRRHQLRRHCKSIFHPIIGDTVYGHGAHNRFFREVIGVSRLLLHHLQMELDHPRTGQKLQLRAEPDQDWQRVLHEFRWNQALDP